MVIRKQLGTGRTLVAALLAGALPFAALAQERDLDSEPSDGKVISSRLDAEGNPARFLLTQRAGEGLDLTVMPVSGSDPYLRVYDAVTDELLAENDDANGSLAANVRLYSEAARRLRVEVSGAGGGAPAMRYDLVVRPSDYRPSPPRAIVPGETVTGVLQQQGEQLFRFRAERGEQWGFFMGQGEESGVDPAVAVYAGENVAGAVLGEDDDGGGGLNARLRFTAPSTGNYVARAYAVGSSEGGYTFTANQGPPPEVRLEEVELGASVAGSLNSAAPEQFYRLGAASRTALAETPGALVIELRHADEGELDPVLEVGFDTPLGFSSLLSDDDGGGDSNARLEFNGADLTPEWLEALRIKAGAFGESTGEYELLVSRAGD
jgi:hypothetical protein